MHSINIQLSFCLIVNYSIRSSPFGESHQFHLLWCQSELPFLTVKLTILHMLSLDREDERANLEMDNQELLLMVKLIGWLWWIW